MGPTSFRLIFAFFYDRIAFAKYFAMLARPVATYAHTYARN